MKLTKKTRIGGKVKRVYGVPKTPYQRIMRSNQISKETKKKLKALYLSLNPAQLKREIETKIDKLYQIVETYPIDKDFYPEFGYLVK